MQAYLRYTQVEVLINRVALKLGVPVSCRFLFFRIYTLLSVCAVWSVALFVRCFRKHHTLLQSGHRQFTSRPSSSQGFFSYGLSCISGFYTFPGRPFWRMRSETSVECWYALSTCLAGQKGRRRFFLNIFRKKRLRPFWPTASLSKYGHFSCALKASPGLPWWRSGWEFACQCRGHGFEPWSGKIPHATEQLGLWATTTEHARLEPVLRNERPP